MTALTPESVKTALANVQDPTIERPLLKLGRLRDIEVRGEQISLTVDLASPGSPDREAIHEQIKSALAPLSSQIQVDFGLKVPRKPPRQDLDRLPTVKNVIAVAAGKGGVGKSTTSVNLALALKAMGAKVGMLDGDIYGPSLPKMLGPATRHAEKSEDGTRITPAIHRDMPMMSIDFFVESGRAVIWRGPMIHKLLQQFLEDVEWGEIDYLIIDLPPGTGDAQLSLGQLIPITAGLIVTTPQEVALLDVRKAVDMFKKLDVPVSGVLENMSYYDCPACGHHDTIFSSGGGERLAQELQVPLLGKLPLDKRIAFGGERGEPIMVSEPEGGHAKILKDVAAKVALECARLSATGPRRSVQLRTV